jgi:hypothetical protein
MTIEVKGHIKLIGELQTFNSGFVKIQIVVTTEGEFPTDIPIDFLGDKTDYLQGYGEGEQVVVSANLKGSEYQGKYYLGLNAWKIQRANSQPQQSEEFKRPGTEPNTLNTNNEYKTNTNPKEFEPSANFDEENDDPLPF